MNHITLYCYFELTLRQTGSTDSSRINPFTWQGGGGPSAIGPITSYMPLKDLSDAVMVKMMADENRMQWSNSPAATNEAIEGAQEILEGAIAASDTLADFRGFAGELAKLSKGWKPSDWSRIKNSGEAGVKMIHDFLGESWATGVIQSSLNVINADRIAANYWRENFAI